ncbi:MAG: hypothetical protein U0670_08845 [Anaerolineae bacterium]
MSELLIGGEVADRLEAMAKSEQISVEELLIRLMNARTVLPVITDEQRQTQLEARRALAGVFKDDMTDLSVTIRETLRKHFEDTDADTG